MIHQPANVGDGVLKKKWGSQPQSGHKEVMSMPLQVIFHPHQNWTFQIKIQIFGGNILVFVGLTNIKWGFLKWGYPKSSIQMGFSIVNHDFLDTISGWSKHENFPKSLPDAWFTKRRSSFACLVAHTVQQGLCCLEGGF